MSRIYDIAEKMDGHRFRPVTSALDGAERAANIDQSRVATEAVRLGNQRRAMEIAEYEERAGVRDAQASADIARAERSEAEDRMAQGKMEFEDRMSRHAQAARIMQGVNEDNYADHVDELRELMPEADIDDVWDETTQADIDKHTDYFNEVLQSENYISRIKERIENGDPRSAALEQILAAERAKQELATIDLQEKLAEIAKIESETIENISTAEKNRRPKADQTKVPATPQKTEVDQARTLVQNDDAFGDLDNENSERAANWIAARAKQIQNEQKITYPEALPIAEAEARGMLNTTTEEGWIWDSESVTFGEPSVDRDAILAEAKAALDRGADEAAVRDRLRTRYGIDDVDF